jgi:DNA-binding beta-propeller fold protein YncE
VLFSLGRENTGVKSPRAANLLVLPEFLSSSNLPFPWLETNLMSKSLSAWSVLLPGLLMIAFLAGCGGVSANTPRPTPTPTPNPSPSPNPTPAAHGTFVYFNTSASNTVGYRLNPDGTLVALAGSPFPVSGALAAAGNFLAASSANAVTTFQVDPATGALSPAGSGAVTSGGPIAADANNVYVAGNIPANTSTGIYGFAISGNGALTALAGSPYTFTGACDLCDEPFALALNNNVLIQGGTGFHGVGDFTTYARGANGVLGKAQILGTDAEERVAIQHPAGNFSYALNIDDSSLNEFTIGASGNATPGSQLFTGSGQDMVIDPANKFLLVVDSAGVVHVFAIAPADGSVSQIGTSEAAGNGATGIAMDPSGQFVFVTQSATANQITVFTFDEATGAMKKLQSYPQSSTAGRVIVIAR